MKSRTFWFIGVVLLAWLPLLRGDAGHEPGQSIQLFGRLDPAAAFDERCEFSTEIEPVSFKLTSFKDKYKVVRIRVDNRKGESIKLSADKDGVELVLSDKIVKGTLNLKAQDGPVWDSLDEEMRKFLAYPLSIRALKVGNGSSKREETIYFFAFFPAEKVSEVPHLFRFTIESLGKTISLEQRAAAKE